MTRTVLITGANKGIGKQIAMDLAKTGQFHVLLTARQEDLGQQATQEINSKYPNTTTFLPLDVTSQASVDNLVQHLEKQQIQLDILINNAGIYIRNIDNEQSAQSTLDVNYFGVARLTEALLPHLSKAKEARIITVSSLMGQLAGKSSLAKELQFLKLVQTNQVLSRQQLDVEANDFITSSKSQETIAAKGWPKSAYRTSKILVNQYNRYLATIVPSNVIVAVTHPGWVQTDVCKNNIY